jgi:hypothetical protein
MRSEIRVKIERDPKWPTRCACCGREASTTTRVDWTKNTGEYLQKVSHYAPACAVCSVHRRKAVHYAETSLNLILFYGGTLISFLIGIAGGIWWGVLAFSLIIVLIRLIVRFEKRRYADAMALLTKECTGADFVWFSGEVFTFANEDYALDFMKLNQGVLALYNSVSKQV